MLGSGMLYLGGGAAIVTGALSIWNGEDKRQGAIAIAVATASILAGLFFCRGGCG
jgi:hypothetical protein